MAKKWYNFFVSTEEAGAEAKGSAPASGASARGRNVGSNGVGDNTASPGGSRADAAQSVADIVAQLGDPPTFPASATANSFEEIYAAAEIRPPAHGFTIFKIAEMLQSEHIKNLPAGVRRSSILVALDASGVNVQEVIEDAVRRDRALDVYERVRERAVADLEQKKTSENQGIQAEMDRIVAEHRARMQANSDDIARSREEFRAWRLQKQQEEQRIFEAVSYFVTENPITTGSARDDLSAPANRSAQSAASENPKPERPGEKS